MEAEVWLISDAAGQPIGYMRLPRHHFGEELAVNEVSRLSFDAALAALHHLTALAEARGTPGVRLCLPASCTVAQAARSFGAHDLGTYAWQIYIPNAAALLRTLAPALEKRVAHSPFAGLTRNVPLSLYRQTINLQFIDGRLVAVDESGSDTGEAIRMPLQAFTPLVLGYRSIDELRPAYADLGIPSALRLLAETLFPKLSSFLYTIY
jgi:hypothetical protein